MIFFFLSMHKTIIAHWCDECEKKKLLIGMNMTFNFNGTVHKFSDRYQ